LWVIKSLEARFVLEQPSEVVVELGGRGADLVGAVDSLNLSCQRRRQDSDQQTAVSQQLNELFSWLSPDG
jgi:hypothetical protein